MHTRRVGAAAAVLALSGACLGQASFQGVGALPGYQYSWVYALSGDGLVVAGVCASQTESNVPFRWTKGGGMEPLQLSPCGGASVHTLNYDGSVAGGSACFTTPVGPACY